MVLTREFITKHLYLLTLIILMAFFLLTAVSTHCYPASETISHQAGSGFVLGKILLQNLTFVFMILLGALTFNISTFCLVAYNGYAWGISFKDVYCKSDLFTTAILFFPHGLLEIIWITLCVRLSVDISFAGYDFFQGRLLSAEFLNRIKSYFPKFFIIVILVLIAGLVESFITPLLVDAL